MNYSTCRAVFVATLIGVTQELTLAHSELLCVKSKVAVKDNKVDLGNAFRTVSTNRCPRNYRLVKDLAEISDPQLIGFARADGSGTMLSFGGNGTTGVTVQQINDGGTNYRFTFSGVFSALTATDTPGNQNRISILTSAETKDYGVTNAYVNSASASQIVVTVYIWKSSDLTADFQNGVYVALLLGQAPTG